MLNIFDQGSKRFVGSVVYPWLQAYSIRFIKIGNQSTNRLKLFRALSWHKIYHILHCDEVNKFSVLNEL